MTTDIMLSSEQLKEYQEILPHLKSYSLTARQTCDLELILNGGFAPLVSFLGEEDYKSVLTHMRLKDKSVWPMPITLDINRATAEQFQIGEQIALRDSEGLLLAILSITEMWQPNKREEALAVFGTEDTHHPGVNYLFNKAGDIYVSGKLFGVALPHHYDFKHLRKTPAELRQQFNEFGWKQIVAFQTRNPMHRAHQELTLRAAKEIGGNLLINPVVGMTKPGDIDHYTRVRCYETLLNRYPKQSTLLSLLQLAMRMAGPREALWHAIIRKNHACTHFIIGRDHAGPGKDTKGRDFYGPYDAQELVESFQNEIGIQMVPFQEMVYVANKTIYKPINEVANDDEVSNISGTEFRRHLQEGSDIPEWFSYPEIIAELRKTKPPKDKQGFTLFFTGLSGAGKSTIANALMIKLLEMGGRSVTLLDGDLIRKNLSSELGFSKEHRDLNILRIGYVASEITKHRGIAICAPIAPYINIRQQVREMITEVGGFVEIYVATPLDVCEKRDRKGLYAKARAGQLKGFTGIDDPYEAPEKPEILIDTTQCQPEEAIEHILLKLKEFGYLK